ncbi:hypothetical protein EDB80DRAFT_884426 [Ilyonectria destructans]|nr:hypothetical protein EDB80DRAFT_884426 [Ilyonectria destructans]
MVRWELYAIACEVARMKFVRQNLTPVTIPCVYPYEGPGPLVADAGAHPCFWKASMRAEVSWPAWNFLHNSVEDLVRAIIEQLKQVEEVNSAFDKGKGIIFENHPHAISDVAEEVIARDTPSTPLRTPDRA